MREMDRTQRADHVIGLISDTHGLVRAEALGALVGVELILHAGDVGGEAVLEALESIAPVQAVYGNVDDPDDPALMRERTIDLGGLSIHVSHGHEFPRVSPELVLAVYDADIVLFGHTHRAVVVRAGRRLAVNPGAAGPRRFDLQPSLARLTISGGRADVEIVPLRA